MTELYADRLVLRPIGREVARALLDGRAPEGVVLAPGYPSRFSVEVLEMVARSAPEANGGFGPFFMVRKADGAVVGEIGASLDGATARVGYTVVEPSWGQGYATEALRALLAHLLADPRVHPGGGRDPRRARGQPPGDGEGRHAPPRPAAGRGGRRAG